VLHLFQGEQHISVIMSTFAMFGTSYFLKSAVVPANRRDASTMVDAPVVNEAITAGMGDSERVLACSTLHPGAPA
jgi:hypothetical protein